MIPGLSDVYVAAIAGTDDVHLVCDACGHEVLRAAIRAAHRDAADPCDAQISERRPDTAVHGERHRELAGGIGERARAAEPVVAEALRRLTDLGFIDSVDDAMLRLRPALMRFAEPVRDLSDRQAALERLVRSGEITLGEAVEKDDSDEEDENDGSDGHGAEDDEEDDEETPTAAR